MASKNLFNFKLEGTLDDEVKAMEAQFEKMMTGSPKAKQMSDRMKELELKHDQESNMEYVSLLRAASLPFIKSFSENDALKYGGEQSTTTSIKVPTSHDGAFDVPVEIYAPKVLENETKRAAYIYAHGGGAVCLSAADVRTGVQCAAV